jgi:hypothetical protein
MVNSSDCWGLIPSSTLSNYYARITVTYGSGPTVSWSPTTFLSNPFIEDPVANAINTTTTYTCTVSYNGCTATDSETITVIPNVSTPVFSLGATSTRCQGASNVTYTVSAPNNSGLTYTLDASSLAGGNTINATTGEVSYDAGWTGTSVITVSAAGCSGPLTATHTVTIMPSPTVSIAATPNVCTGSNVQLDATVTPSGGGTATQTYNIALSDLVGLTGNCGSTGSQYNNCTSGYFGFNWTDAGVGVVTAVQLQFSVGVECASGTTRTTQFNGVAGPNFSATPDWCQCDGSSASNIVTMNLSAANYIVGGVNQFRVYDGGSCWGLIPSTTLSNYYARITVTYSTNATVLWTPSTFLSGTTIANPVANGITTTTTYTFTATLGSCQSASTHTVNVLQASSWAGFNSNDWFSPSNWCLSGAIPTNTTDVYIPDSSLTLYDVSINNSGAVCRNITIGPNGLFGIAGANQLTVYGNWTNSGSFSSGSSLVRFAGGSAQQISGSSMFSNLELDNTHGLTTTSSVNIGSLLRLRNGTFSHSGNLILGSGCTVERYQGCIGSAPSFSGNVDLAYYGCCTTSCEIPSNVSLVQQLTIDAGTLGVVELGGPLQVNSQLTFASGILRSGSSSVLRIGDGAVLIGAGPRSFVDGPIEKQGDDAFVFPLGDISGTDTVWAPIGISDPGSSVSDVFRAEYFYSTPPNNWDLDDMCPGSNLDHVSGLEYWELSRISGSTYPDVTIYWKDAQRSGINDLSDLAVSHLSDCSGDLRWHNMGGTGTGSLGPGGSGEITGTGFTSYSPISFGSKSGFSNPLPVELLEFTAYCDGSATELRWSTATEQNSWFYSVERSVDAQTYEEVGSVPASGNSSTVLSYSFRDAFAVSGTSYYRLKQMDQGRCLELLRANCCTLSG